MKKFIGTDQLQQALDNINSYSGKLSQVFQKLGNASTGPTAEVS